MNAADDHAAVAAPPLATDGEPVAVAIDTPEQLRADAPFDSTAQVEVAADDVGGDEPAVSETAEQQAPPHVGVLPPCPPPDTTLADLFGAFQPITQSLHCDDPTLYDVGVVCQALFGDTITEHEVYRDLHLQTDADDHRFREINENERLMSLQPVLDAFGDRALDFFTEDLISGGNAFEHAKLVACDRPANPFNHLIESPTDALWLLDMPKLQPNRQVLHLADRPFDAKSAVRPRDTPRSFYTPQNLIQWAKAPKSGKVYSNARIARWSNGSTTLHVGSDVYELPDNHEVVLSMLATEAQMAPDAPIDAADEESTKKNAQSVFVETVPVTRHMSVVPAANVPSSVSEALIGEIVKNRAGRNPEKSLRFLQGAVPTIRTKQERNAGPASSKKLTPEETFMEVQRRAHERKIKEAAANGHPLSPLDIIQLELEATQMLTEAVRDGSIEALARNVTEEEGRTHGSRKGEEGAPRTRTAESRFERPMDLVMGESNPTASATAFAAALDQYDKAGSEVSDEGDVQLASLLKRQRSPEQNTELVQPPRLSPSPSRSS